MAPGKTEAEWKAESDAYSLAEARDINEDPARLKAAQTAADKLAADKQEQAAHLHAVALGNPKPKATVTRRRPSHPKVSLTPALKGTTYPSPRKP